MSQLKLVSADNSADKYCSFYSNRQEENLETYRIHRRTQSAESIRRHMSVVKSPHPHDICAMHGQQKNRFKGTEQNNIRSRREEALRAMSKKVGAILVLHNRLDAQNDGIPQRDDVQWDALVNQSGPIKFVIAIHTKLFMLVLDYVVVDLRRRKRKIHLIWGFFI